jgi:ATP-dependent helicase/nuclease subunit A
MSKETSSPELNKEQQAAAFCTENAVVAAGAGSGKTMVLASRFAWLLTEKGYKVDEILTLTFTKKAAAQMYKRIHSLLSEIAERENGVKAARAREALDNFIHARIQTLDSYSASLVRQCAPRYGISPDFEIDPERCLKIANEEALPFLITYRHHPAIERLYAENRPNDIVRNFFTDVMCNYCFLDKPVNFIEDVKAQFDLFCGEWKKQRDELTTIFNEIENYAAEDRDMLPDIVPLIEKYKNKDIVIPEIKEIQNYFDFLLNLPPQTCVKESESHPLQSDIVKLIFFLYEIDSLKLYRGKKPKEGNPIKERVYQIRSLFGKFSSLAVSCMQAGFIISIMSLLAELQDRYLQRKRAEGVLTFNDVARLSRTILLEQEDIRQSEKESFKAIMIDEFQDNNELQKDLLFLLAEKPEVLNKNIPPAKDLAGGKLFFVGDEKQSIYFFRGADVSVFRKLKDEIKSAELPLKINYRSVPALIGAFNAIFGGSGFDPKGKDTLSKSPSVFAPSLAETPLPLYEASYTPLEANNDGKGNFSIFILDKKDDGNYSDEDYTRLSVYENEARFIAEKIEKLLCEKTESGAQKYRAKDIAILFRSRGHQHLYEKHLRLLGIPYTCEDINDLFYSGLVNDIMSVLRLASYPLDSAAYAEMLRSPFAGLSVPAAAVCLSIFSEAESPEPFNNEPLSFLNEEDREKYRHGQRIYASIRGKSATASVSSLISELWYNEGYRYEAEWNPGTSVYRELFDYLFHLAVKSDAENQGLSTFTDSIRAIRDSGKRLTDIEIPLERPGAVSLMTIHKSKGLEFPVVFLCGCGRHSQPNTGENVFSYGDAGIVFSPPLPPACYSIPKMRKNFFWEKASAEIRRKRTAELRRLLYVGMTRAEKELYLTGVLDINDGTETDDLSIKIKNYTEKERKNKENQVYGDSIIDNDTFFGLILPSIASHVPQDTPQGGVKMGASFFNLEAIPVYTEEYIKNQETKTGGFTNDQKGLYEYLKKVEPFYQKAEIIQTPDIKDNHITPVSLRNREEGGDEETELSGRGVLYDTDYSGEKADDVFEKVDSMLVRFSRANDDYTERFNSGGFGTIAHICVDAYLNGQEPVIPSNISCLLTPAETDAFLAAGRELARRFVRSPLGKIAERARLRESEFSFRSFLKNRKGREVFINGTIDLFFDDRKFIHVVDFKTDGKETPAEHTAQMACYHKAVCDLFALPAKKQCRPWLYYLRTGHAVDMAQRIKLYNLEHRMFS